MIEVKDLTKFYGRVMAVNGISFEVGEGQIVGFLGPNGAGKTTTIRILTCFHPASSGAATIGGYDVFQQSMDVRRIVGYLPELTPLYPEMRPREYLRFRGKLRGLDRRECDAAIGRVAERCWITDMLDRPIGALSKGYKQRVGLADALLHSPKVLILDEPTVGLDPTQIRETRSLIRELAQDHTVMLSSHILPEVEATCQKIVIIHRGELVAAGTSDDLRKQLASDAATIVEVKGNDPQVAATLGALPGVSNVEAVMHGDWMQMKLEAASDLREQVFRMATEQGWALRELRRSGATLEDFFVKIVAQASAKSDAYGRGN